MPLMRRANSCPVAGSASPDRPKLTRASSSASVDSRASHEAASDPDSAAAKSSTTLSRGESMWRRRATESYAQYSIRLAMSSLTYDVGLGVTILVSFILLWYEAGVRNRRTGTSTPLWTGLIQGLFSCMYTIEVALRIYAERTRCLYRSWDRFDVAVVFIGQVGEIAGWVLGHRANLIGFIRACRVIRLLRMFRVLKRFKDLWSLVSGLVSAARTLFWAGILMFIILSMWSLIAVEVLDPLMSGITQSGMYSECPWCPDAFKSVMASNLTLFGCISGGDWPMLAIPLMTEHPWTAIIFVSVVFIMFFGMLNLITAVIVDAAAAARAHDLKANSRQRQEEQKKALKRFETLCKEMDTDRSGTISFEEVEDGFHNVPDFAALMQIMDIGEQDLQCVFDILDQDRTGEVDYREFAQQLWKIKAQEVKTTLMFVKHYVIQMKNRVEKQISECRRDVVSQSKAMQLRLDRLSTLMINDVCSDDHAKRDLQWQTRLKDLDPQSPSEAKPLLDAIGASGVRGHGDTGGSGAGNLSAFNSRTCASALSSCTPTEDDNVGGCAMKSNVRERKDPTYFASSSTVGIREEPPVPLPDPGVAREEAHQRNQERASWRIEPQKSSQPRSPRKPPPPLELESMEESLSKLSWLSHDSCVPTNSRLGMVMAVVQRGRSADGGVSPSTVTPSEVNPAE